MHPESIQRLQFSPQNKWGCQICSPFLASTYQTNPATPQMQETGFVHHPPPAPQTSSQLAPGDDWGRCVCQKPSYITASPNISAKAAKSGKSCICNSCISPGGHSTRLLLFHQPNARCFRFYISSTNLIFKTFQGCSCTYSFNPDKAVQTLIRLLKRSTTILTPFSLCTISHRGPRLNLFQILHFFWNPPSPPPPPPSSPPPEFRQKILIFHVFGYSKIIDPF